MVLTENSRFNHLNSLSISRPPLVTVGHQEYSKATRSAGFSDATDVNTDCKIGLCGLDAVLPNRSELGPES